MPGLEALDKSLAIAEKTNAVFHQHFAAPNFNKAEVFREQKTMSRR